MKLFIGPAIYEIYYAAPRNTEGLIDVKVSMWKHDGTQVLNNQSMSEVGDGIYKHAYNFDSTTWYVAQTHSESLNIERTESIRIGSPPNDYVYVVSNDSTNMYEVNKLDGTNVMAGGPMAEVGSTGIYYADVTSLPEDKYFFKLNHKDHARFDYPFKPRGGFGILNFSLMRGFNIAAWTGTGKFTFDASTGTWKYISEDIDTARASDLWNYIHYHYPSVEVKYLKAYDEYPINRFRVYIPGLTPLDDVNNFPLIELNSEGDPESNAFYLEMDTTLAEVLIEAR